jgi:hypothetical protein
MQLDEQKYEVINYDKVTSLASRNTEGVGV